MQPKNMPTRWHKLDNTANLFPVVANKRFTNVYRLTVILSEPVNPELLQQALETMLPYFAAFHVRLRHGLFWSYLETNNARPVLELEQDPPCRYLDAVQTNRFLFRLLYYKNRVHLETFHVLSDGTGAGRFLRAVCYCYCKLKYPDAFTAEDHVIPHGTEHAGNIEDGYVKNYRPMKKRGFREPAAYHLRGERRLLNELGVATALFPVKPLKEICRSLDVSIGVYLTAALAYAIYEEYTAGHGSNKPVNIFVPVNLRPIFQCETSLNFFSNILVGLPLHAPDIPFSSVLEWVKQQFAEKCTKEFLSQKLSYTVSSERALWARIAPLPLKNGILRMVFERSSHGSTMPFSNLGPVVVEPLFRDYIKGFRVLLCPNPKEPYTATAVSLGDTLAMTFGSLLEGQAIARNVVRRLTAAGVPVQLETNDCEEADT